MKTDPLAELMALHETLRKEKADLEKRLAQINEALRGSLSSGSAGGRRKRNPMSLFKAVSEVTRKKPMNKEEILEAIHRLGYRFAAKDPINSLNTTLYTGKRFKNVDGRFSPSR